MQRILCIIVLSILILGCGISPKDSDKREGEDKRIKVITSINPYADFARQVGRDKVTVLNLVPTGASPHTFSPKPSQLKYMSNADILILNGLNLEFWAKQAISAADNPRLKIITMSDGLDIIRDEEGHEEGKEEHHHDHSLGNPHIWLNPVYAKEMVKRIEQALIAVDKGNASYYEKNAGEYIAKLDSLDMEIRYASKTWKKRDFITFHASFTYFAREYGLNQVAVIERIPGKEPTPSEIRKIVDDTKKLGIEAIFTEPQFPLNISKSIAEAAHVRVAVLDPVGEGYLQTMKINLRVLNTALNGE